MIARKNNGQQAANRPKSLAVAANLNKSPATLINKRSLMPPQVTKQNQLPVRVAIMRPSDVKVMEKAPPLPPINKIESPQSFDIPIELSAAKSAAMSRGCDALAVEPSSLLLKNTRPTRASSNYSEDYLDLDDRSLWRSSKQVMNNLDSNLNNGLQRTSVDALMSFGAVLPTSMAPVRARVIGRRPADASTTNKCTATASCTSAWRPHNSVAVSINVRLSNQRYESASIVPSHHDATISNESASRSKAESEQTSAVQRPRTVISAPSVDSFDELKQAPLEGKSYLRSQYERRQKQLELMNKMQSNLANKSNNAVGADACRQNELQQDLVARSHELSKKRFFEKLERRESIKNLNLNLEKKMAQNQPAVACNRSVFDSLKSVIDATCYLKADPSSCEPANRKASSQQPDQQVDSNQTKYANKDESKFCSQQPIVIEDKTTELTTVQLAGQHPTELNDAGSPGKPIKDWIVGLTERREVDTDVSTSCSNDTNELIKFDIATLSQFPASGDEISTRNQFKDNVRSDLKLEGSSNQATASNENINLPNELTVTSQQSSNDLDEKRYPTMESLDTIIKPNQAPNEPTRSFAQNLRFANINDKCLEQINGDDQGGNPIQKDSGSQVSSADEDRNSFCSSSGFGASVSASVSGSTDGSASINGSPTLMNVDGQKSLSGGLNSHRQNSSYQRPDNPIYNNVYCSASYQIPKTRKPTNLKDCPTGLSANHEDQVGPDQSYPKGCPLIVENHNYASVSVDQFDSVSQLDASIVLERDDVLDGYANLPVKLNKASSMADYATVRSTTTKFHQNIDNHEVEKDDNDKALYKKVSSTDNLSVRSCVSSSGGFSVLKPVKSQVSTANNCNSPNENVDICPTKRSILKRFGSLVSRAFTVGGNGVQKASEVDPVKEETGTKYLEEKVGSNGDACMHHTVDRSNRSESKLIDSNEVGLSSLPVNGRHQPRDPGEGSELVCEADLVILPTKHINLKKPNQNQLHCSLVLHSKEQSKSKNCRLDDRLSREAKLGIKIRQKSRKSKKATFVLSSASATDSDESHTDHRSSSPVENNCNGHEHPADGYSFAKWHSKRSDSMFEDLESLVSRSEKSNDVNEMVTSERNAILRRSARQLAPSSRWRHTMTRNQRFDIDCVSPGRATKNSNVEEPCEPRGVSRSLLGIFSSSNKSHQTVGSSPDISATITRDNSATAHRSPVEWDGNECNESKGRSQQSNSGFWGLTSLMSYNHAIDPVHDEKTIDRKSKKKTFKVKVDNGNCPNNASIKQESSELAYSSLQPFRVEHQANIPKSQRDSLEGYQSLSLYQNFLRNYAKRRERGHSSHNSSHHHCSRHRSSSSQRHDGRCSGRHRSSRCGYDCARRDNQPCNRPSSALSKEDAVVWGQLIKIKKTDGSQLIELHRAPGKSWGFFVARGAINNVKGIFISRMHDKITSNSLTGLLSIGDRILAIDDCPIGPEHDILRVNQMISKRTKILLRVKPFKG